jgi:hypothetical protein
MSKEDVVGGTYRKKNLSETYVCKAEKMPELPEPGSLMPVSGLGCGFLRFSKAAIDQLFNASEKYTEQSKTGTAAVFETKVVDGQLKSEDIVACEKWASLGGTVWLDPDVTVDHHDGGLKYSGNFRAWYAGIKNAQKSIE